MLLNAGFWARGSPPARGSVWRWRLKAQVRELRYSLWAGSSSAPLQTASDISADECYHYVCPGFERCKEGVSTSAEHGAGGQGTSDEST